jgi:uncharacterized protein
MVKSAIIIHGSIGHPEENWFPWLGQELEKRGYRVFIPAFPTPDGQSYQSWLEVFKNLTIDKEAILIGHSTGPIFILNALQDMDLKIKACFLVAPFLENLGNEYFDSLNSSFLAKERDWSDIRSKCHRFFVYYSDNDPYVPEQASLKVAKLLQAEQRQIKKAGHFNEAAGYTSFPQILTDIDAFYTNTLR